MVRRKFLRVVWNDRACRAWRERDAAKLADGISRLSPVAEACGPLACTARHTPSEQQLRDVLGIVTLRKLLAFFVHVGFTATSIRCCRRCLHEYIRPSAAKCGGGSDERNLKKPSYDGRCPFTRHRTTAHQVRFDSDGVLDAGRD